MQPIFSDKNQVLIVDWCNLLARSYAIQPANVASWLELYTKMVLRLVQTHENCIIFFALEGDGKLLRRKIYPEYKLGARLRTGQVRPKRIDKLALKVLGLIPCKLVYSADGEADDAIASLVKLKKSKFSRFLILTEDRDLYQLIEDPQVAVLNKKEQVVDELGAYNVLGGVAPRSLTLYKSLMGDRSDNIPKVPRLGKQDAVLLTTNITSVKRLFKTLKKADFLPEKKQRILTSKTCKALIKRNYRLVKLRRNLPLKIKKQKADPKGLYDLLTTHGLYRWSLEELTKILRGD